MSAKRSSPKRLRDPLQRVLQRIDPEKRLQVYRVWTFWREEVGEAIAARSEPAAFRAGVLVVRVSSAAWMQELQLMKEKIRERLNERLGGERIRDVYFVSGPTVRDDVTPPLRAQPSPSPLVREAPAPLPRLRDPKLSAVFERIVAAHRRARDRSDRS